MGKFAKDVDLAAAYGSSMRQNGDVDLRDFESIVRFLSEEEINESQVAIDRRRAEELAREVKDYRNSEEDLAMQPTA